MSNSITSIQGLVNYQNSQNARNSDSDASIDRARGGIIQITLTIPSKTYPVRGGKGGQVTTDKMVVTLAIDLEELPLVNTAGYKVEEEQIEPDVMPYPYGAHGTYAETFS
jgi:hypothetical protein